MNESKCYKEYFKNEPPIYSNISIQFTGIGHIMIDGTALIDYIYDRFNLNCEALPLHTFKHGTAYFVSNLIKAGFDEPTIFFRNETGHRGLIKEYLSTVFKSAKFAEIAKYVENERVALFLGGDNDEGLNILYKCLGNSIYCGTLKGIKFTFPYVYAYVYSPLTHRTTEPFDFADESDEVDESINEDEINKEISKLCEGENLDSIRKKFVEHNKVFGKCEYKIPLPLCKLLKNYLKHKKELFFDGRFILPTEEVKEDTDELRYKGLNEYKDRKRIERDTELDLLINLKEVKGTSYNIHMKNLRKSAQSLFGGQLLYAPIVRGKETKPPKISQKQRKIMEENEKRMQEEQNTRDRIWLKNFYAKYKNADNKGKKKLLECVKSDNQNIYRKVLLLKIEYYFGLWNLEKTNDEADESKIVPCYLCCLEYIRSYGLNTSKDELEFVLQTLIDLGFEATTKEIIENFVEYGCINKLKNIDSIKSKGNKKKTTDANNIDIYKNLNLKFYTEDTSAPSEYDICFQLKYAGDKLQRSLNSKSDPRVLFTPDEWQVKLLNLVDANKSAVISAPTSAGKTFICFYAIEKILKQSDTDVVIFCLPTKALVNQVTADVYARFTPKVNSKTLLQGSLMKDFSTEPWNCQVLITIPSLLESLLSSPPKGFIERVKYVIIDEVHKISSEEMGAPIERIIHLSPCPMLVLSATLGNLECFYKWFKNIENKKNRECELVFHNERYCELKPFVYSESSLTSINNLFAYSYDHIKNFGFGNDINFLPEELLYLYDSICAVLHEEQLHLMSDISPERFFKSNIITKSEVKNYEKHLLKTFQGMIEKDILNEKQVKYVYKLQTRKTKKVFDKITDFSQDYLMENMLNLLNELKSKDMLPCIVFNTDRDFVSKLAAKVYNELESMDKEKKKDKLIEKMKKEAKKNRDVEKTKDSWIEESQAAEESFEMKKERKNIKYTFLDSVTKLTEYELDEETEYIKNTDHKFIDMLYRGIGVHHAHMNRRYRNLVEILFRQKHLQVLFATDTLALGINMPCRSVIFAGDSLELDPMNYKQMAGRAGRRGFDTLGNIIFMGIPKLRVQNLMVSLLPNIRGTYTYTNTGFIGFNIKESLIEYPLLSSIESNNKGNTKSNDDELDKINELATKLNRVNFKDTYDLSDIFNNKETRAKLVEFQLDLIKPYITNNSYLADLVVSNRDSDPSIFSFILLLETGILSLEPSDLIVTIAHFFEVKPLPFDMGYSLPPLDENIRMFCKDINNIYLKSLIKYYNPTMKSLQMMSDKPLHNLLSFICIDTDTFKNSYLLDFYKHGSWEKINNVNHIRSAELFKSLSVVDNLIKSLIRLYDEYKINENSKNKLVYFHSLFEPKFKAFHA